MFGKSQHWNSGTTGKENKNTSKWILWHSTPSGVFAFKEGNIWPGLHLPPSASSNRSPRLPQDVSLPSECRPVKEKTIVDTSGPGEQGIITPATWFSSRFTLQVPWPSYFISDLHTRQEHAWLLGGWLSRELWMLKITQYLAVSGICIGEITWC